MSQGDPSLVLNYWYYARFYSLFISVVKLHCDVSSREYWDGKNITPLSIADREKVLNIYERWDLGTLL